MARQQRWKGRVQPGVSEQVVCTIDLASSLAALTGTTLPDNACRDSFNVLPALLGESGAKGRDHLLQQDNNGASFGLRMGGWKLVRSKARGKSQAVVSVKPHTYPAGLHALYFLPDDPAEENDLSAKNPEKTQEMIAKLDALIAAERSR